MLHYSGTIGHITGHVIELHLQPPPTAPAPIPGQADITGSKPQPSNHMVGPSDLASPLP